MDEDLKNHLSSPSIWLRLLYMVLFAFILQGAIAIFWVVVIVQFLFALFTGQPHARIAHLADILAQYITECVEFECFRSEEKPFPFQDFPESRVDGDNVVEGELAGGEEGVAEDAIVPDAHEDQTPEPAPSQEAVAESDTHIESDEQTQEKEK